ncbi:unnamed protein product [Clonostachys rhizophaga]|uniref:Uncharacterized protein n=1 Tax=Clonostachys rhizophaga TaxID=160324 RepID=A0A9N9VG96_9HYPO|nr:unnamed protein product [Clonostachys rhizophaga]
MNSQGTKAVIHVKVLLDMPGHGHDAVTTNGEKQDELYMQCKSWVENKPVEKFDKVYQYH